eukprot:Skav213940  [mRNA]  locus=scaffold2679:309751:310248:+ [translate_table: standard]
MLKLIFTFTALGPCDPREKLQGFPKTNQRDELHEYQLLVLIRPVPVHDICRTTLVAITAHHSLQLNQGFALAPVPQFVILIAQRAARLAGNEPFSHTPAMKIMAARQLGHAVNIGFLHIVVANGARLLISNVTRTQRLEDSAYLAFCLFLAVSPQAKTESLALFC